MFDHFFALYCPDCGGKIQDEDEYCPHCGTDLEVSINHGEGSTLPVELNTLKSAQQIYDSGSNLEQALLNCEIVLEHNPELADAHNLLGLILDDMGRTDEAIQAYIKALEINPSHEDARANLSDAEKEMSEIAGQQQENIKFEPVFRFWRAIIKFAISAFVVLIIFTVAGGLYDLGRFYLTPKTTLILEPDFTQKSFSIQDDLQKSVDILIKRSNSLGFSQVTFTTSGDNEIIAKIPVYIDAEVFIARIDYIGLVEFVDFGTTPISLGETVITDFDQNHISGRQEVVWHTVMTNAEIKQATSTQDNLGNYLVAFTLTESGKEIFADHTSQNVNSFLGIVLDKVVISVPIIHSTIPDGEGTISGDFIREEAEELAAVLNTSPLPFPIKIKE